MTTIFKQGNEIDGVNKSSVIWSASISEDKNTLIRKGLFLASNRGFIENNFKVSCFSAVVRLIVNKIQQKSIHWKDKNIGRCLLVLYANFSCPWANFDLCLFESLEKLTTV